MSEPEPPLDPDLLNAYFALMDVAALLRHSVEQQLREEGDLSYVQFQVMATLYFSEAGSARMTDLADGIVHSRSGLTYQVGLLEKAGLVTRAPSERDERGVTVTITEAGRERLELVMPGHREVVNHLLLQPLPPDSAVALVELLGPVREHLRAAPPRSARPRGRR
ncbi:MarR family transcriptional regulator [Nocardioides sp. cx-169]|uniref:MarR family winged helix-turn-helix transcriptional regulator n=1 Tax=Nocardioides sp. cx-169 TaxID=2899080 RepID=UPI001E59ED34|nr:MarR family transcriptional regulator [Nocardioides sp. cx-169]MCD4532683.1 MarR family transcriptional regulator [Nocardioides sp. cx-169]